MTTLENSIRSHVDMAVQAKKVRDTAFFFSSVNSIVVDIYHVTKTRIAEVAIAELFDKYATSIVITEEIMKMISPVANKPATEKLYLEIEFPEHIKELYVYVKDGRLIVADADKVDIPDNNNKLAGKAVIHFASLYGGEPDISVCEFTENQIIGRVTETKTIGILDLSE